MDKSGNINVLLVDNKKGAYASTRHIFKNFNNNSCKLESTKSYNKALSLIKKNSHDIYLIGENLGIESGLDLLREARAINCCAPIFLLASEDNNLVKAAAIKAGATDYLIINQIETAFLERTFSFALEHSYVLRALRKSEAKYRNLIETLPVMFYAVEAVQPYQPIYISPAFESLGFKVEEWYEDPAIWQKILHPEDRERINQLNEKALKTGENIDYEYRVVAKDGTIFTVHDRGQFIKDESGKIICCQGIVFDVTKAKIAEEELKRRKKLYRTLAHNIPNTAVLLFDQEFRYTLAEGSQLRHHGYTREMFEGKTLFEVFPEELSKEYADYYRRALSGEKINFELENENGYFQVYVVPVKNEFGEIFAGMVMWQDITDRRKAEKALRENEERYHELFENAYDIVYMHDLEGNFISVNRAAERVFGYSRREIIKMNMREFFAPDEFEIVRQKVLEKIKGAKQAVYETTGLAKDGRKVILEINSCGVYENEKLVAIQGIARDITERKSVEDALKISEARFRELFENANDLIYTHDLQGNFTSLNRAGEIITGYSREEALEKNISEIIAPEHLDRARQMIRRKIKGEAPTTYELEIIAKEGHRVTLELSTRLFFENDKPSGVQGIARDITERKITEEKLQFNALYDPLTNLPNRSQFMNHLKQAAERAERELDFRFAVLFLDLDRFKVINDGLGHVIGDKLLVAIAERLKSSLRPGDIVARLGGDEFTFLINNIKEHTDAVSVAERLQNKLSVPFKLENYEVFTSASIGIIVSDEIHRKPEDFLRDADTAMYRAKETGKSRYEVFDREMHVRNMNLLKVETDLRRALEREEFKVFYQPIVELRTGDVCEFEALIRWDHPEYGLISPNEFISVAEESGLIVPIGEWILERACRQTSQWQKTFHTSKPLSISVNLSAKQLMHPTLVGKVKEILAKTNLPASSLKLEVTETMVMTHSEIALSVLSELHDLGITLSTDDFGTGYSSLSYLHLFPFARLKIDRSFVGKMDSDSKSEAIVRTIQMLGHNLNIEVIAEGIETEQQLKRLRSLGCRLGQGYLFSKPVSVEYAQKLLRDGLPDFSFTPSLETSYLFNETERHDILEIKDVQ